MAGPPGDTSVVPRCTTGPARRFCRTTSFHVYHRWAPGGGRLVWHLVEQDRVWCSSSEGPPPERARLLCNRRARGSLKTLLAPLWRQVRGRSEEHTSELQSPCN